jgi:hypothetical protein
MFDTLKESTHCKRFPCQLAESKWEIPTFARLQAIAGILLLSASFPCFRLANITFDTVHGMATPRLGELGGIASNVRALHSRPSQIRLQASCWSFAARHGPLEW